MANVTRSVFLLLLLLSGCGWDGTPTRHNDFVPLTSIEISADSAAIVAQTSIKLTVKGHYSGLFTRDDITSQAVWSSGSPDVAAFVTTTDRARVTGLKPGTSILTATVGSVMSIFTLTVSPGTVTALTITPVNPAVAKGQSAQFAATGIFSDLPPRDITFDVAWSSSAPVVATISDIAASKGFAQAIAIGTSTISAVFGSASGSTLLTVTEPVLKSIALSPANPTILTLSTRSFIATGTYSDGSTANITSQVTWNSSNTDIATIAGDGTAKALTQGTITIRAAQGSVSEATTLKATGGNLTGITVSPATVTLVKDIRALISAKGTFSNNSTRDITGAVTWSVADTTLASVTLPGGNLAWLNPLAVTLVPTTITATSGTRTGTAALTVIAPQLSSIAFSTTTLDLTVGTSSPLAVIATFDNNSSQDVTSLSVWTPGNPAVATVAAGGLGTERVTGVAVGNTTISATYGGKTVLAPAAVTVRSRILQSLTLSPVTSSAGVGTEVSFTATAIYGDGATVDVTREAATDWKTDNQNVAIFADKVNQPGRLAGVDNGSTAITASFGDKTKTATITVTAP